MDDTSFQAFINAMRNLNPQGTQDANPLLQSFQQSFLQSQQQPLTVANPYMQIPSYQPKWNPPTQLQQPTTPQQSTSNSAQYAPNSLARVFSGGGLGGNFQNFLPALSQMGGNMGSFGNALNMIKN